MNSTSLIGLVNNAALLLAMGLLYDLLPLRERNARPGLGKALAGLAVGALGVIIMMNAWTLMPGVIFDTRSVLLAVSGLFFGTVPTIIACIMTSAYRLYQGGGGVVMGVAVIWSSGSLGLLWRHMHRRRLEEISPARLYLLGLAVHLVMLGWMSILPSAIRPEVVRRLAAPVMIVHPTATLLLGLVLAGRHVRVQAETAVRASEERLRQLTENLREMVWLRERESNRIVYVSPAYQAIWGRSCEELLNEPQSFLENIHPDDRERVIAAQRALHQGGAPFNEEYRIVRPDGSLRWVWARTSPITSENGAMSSYAGIAEDITERKEAEAAAIEHERALRREKEVAQRYLDVAPAIIMALDRQGVITLLNQHGARVLECEPHEAIGKDWFATFLPPEARSEIRQVFDRIMAGQMEGVEYYENVVLTARGNRRIVQWHNTLLRDETGQIVGTLTAAEDVTERKQAERALAASEERYRRLVESAHEGIWALDRDFRIVFANQQMAALLGYEPSDLLGRLSTDFMHPDDLEDAAQRRAERMDGRATHYERRFVRRDGSVITTLASGAPLLDESGALVGAVTLFTDITERKRIEDALRESEERYRSLVETAREGIWAMDSQARTTFVNRPMAEMLGYTLEEMIGRLVTDFIPADEWDDHRQRLAERRAGIAGNYERRLVRRDGSIITTLVSATPLLDEQGAYAGTVALFTDITERKLSEEALRLQGMVLDQIQDAVTVTDLEGVITYVNDAECRLLGRSRSELIGASVASYGEDATRGATQAEIIAATRAHGEWRGEVINYAADGREIILDTRTQLVRDAAGRAVAMCGVATDITARRQAEAALRESEARHKLALEGADLGAWDWYPLTGKVILNERWASMLGYTLADLTPHINTWENLLHPDDRERALQILNAHIKGQTPAYECEYRMKHQNGHWVWVLDRGQVIERDAEGRPVRLCGTHLDITARKQAEAALRESEERLRSIYETSPVGIAIVTSADQRIVFANPAMQRLLGYTAEELQQLTVHDITHPDDMAAEQEGVRAVLEGRGRNYSSDKRYIRKDGSVVWVSLTGAPFGEIVNGWPQYGVGLAQDISERVAMEQRLRESEARYRQAQRLAQLGHYDWYADGDRMTWSDEIYQILGLEHNAPPSIAVFEQMIHPEDAAVFANERRRAVREGGVASFEHRVVRPDGAVRHVHEMLEFVCDAEGRLVSAHGTMQDITERKQAEAALRESEDRFRRLVESAPEAIFVQTKSRFAYVNAAALALFGADKPEQLLGQFVPDRFHPDFRAGVIARIHRLNEEQKSVPILEEVILRLDGASVPVEVSAAPITYQGQNGALVFIRDITARKEAEAASQRFFDILNASVNELYMFDAATLRFQFVSSGALRNLGYSLDEMRQMTPLDIKPAMTPEEFADKVAPLRRREAQMVAFETVHRRRDGTTYPVDVNLQLLEQGGEAVFLAVILDVTERKRAEQALRETEERFRLLLQNANDAIYVHELTPEAPGKFLEVNDQACRMLGYTRSEFTAMEIGDIDVPEHRERVPQIIAQLYATGRAVFETEHRAKDGRRIPVEVSTRLFEIGGKSLVLSMARDITERRQAESDRLRLEEQLAQARRLESIGMLAGGVAHDLNNTLTPILGYGQLLRDDLPDDDPHRPELDEIVQSAERARDLVRQLLAFARRQNLTMQPLDLNRVVIRLYNMLRRTLRENIAIETHLTPGLGVISGDIGQIEQIILNLAVNAQDAMPQGGALTIETSAILLDELYAEAHEGVAPGPYVLLTVSDTGVGMDKHTLTHLFEPFFTTKEVGKGTGLGLATVYGIVKQHGGHISAYSEVGLGSTFRIYFPRASEPLAEGEPLQAASQPPRGNETILLVEDQDQVRVLARQLLQRQGYTVLEAHNGQAALTIAAAYAGEIHLLVTDVVMPDLNGPALSERLAAIRPGLKTLYMSGYADEVVAPQGVLAKGEAFIAKPFSLPDFVARVREVLDK